MAAQAQATGVSANQAIGMLGLLQRVGLASAREAAAALAGVASGRVPGTPPPALARPPLLLAYATQTGAAEMFARDTRAQLQRAGVAVRLLPFDALSLDLLAEHAQALIIASTTYDGDAPDMAEAFEDECMRAPASLAHLRYGLLALGDRCYSDFCGFGRRLHAWLGASGAQAWFAPVEVDDEDAQALAEWHRQVVQLAERRRADG